MKQKSVVNIIFCLAVAAALALAAGCRRTTPEALLRADALIEERPDSALAILDSITPAALPSERDRAIHALLSTQARAHTYTPQNDSLVSLALSYFNSEDSLGEYALRARYYKALIDQDYAGDPREALKEYLNTFYLARKSGDRFRAGVSALRIAEIYIDNESPAEALFYSKQANKLLTMTDKPRHIAYSCFLIGHSYCISFMPDSAIRILDRVKEDIKNYCGEEVYDLLNTQIIISKYLKKDFNGVIGMCDADSSLLSRPFNVLYYGLALIEKDDIPGAERTLGKLRSLEDAEDIQIEVLKNTISQYRNSIGGTLSSSDYVLSEINRKNRSRDQLALPEIYLSYLDQKTRLDEETIKKRTYLVWLITVCAAVLAFSVTLIAVRKRKMLKSRLEEQIEFIATLQTDLKKEKTELSESRRRLDELEEKSNRLDNADALINELKDQIRSVRENFDGLEKREAAKSDIAGTILSKYRLLNDISCMDVDYRKLLEKSGKSKFSGELRDLMVNLSSDSAMLKEISAIIDRKCDNVYTRFTSDFPDLPSDMKRLFLYNCMGLNPKFMVQLLDCKNIERVYYLNKKLKSIIKRSDVPDKEHYLNAMEE